MSDAHDFFFALELAVDVRLGVFDLTNLGEHVQHRLVRATMERSVERRDPGRDGRERVDVRRADAAHRARRAVLLMVGMATGLRSSSVQFGAGSASQLART